MEQSIPRTALPVVCGQDIPEPCTPESFGVLDLESPDLRVVCRVDREALNYRSNFDGYLNPFEDTVCRRLTYDLHTHELLDDSRTSVSPIKRWPKKIVSTHGARKTRRDILTRIFYNSPERWFGDEVNPDSEEEGKPIPFAPDDSESTRVPDDTEGVASDSDKPDVSTDDDVNYIKYEPICRPCQGMSEAQLRAEAKSLNHLLTHLPKNPYCEACQTAKLQLRSARRSSKLKKTPPIYGKAGTADHWFTRSQRSKGINGEAVSYTHLTLPTILLV